MALLYAAAAANDLPRLRRLLFVVDLEARVIDDEDTQFVTSLTPLGVAIGHFCDAEIIRALLYAGADPTAPIIVNGEADTPLHHVRTIPTFAGSELFWMELCGRAPSAAWRRTVEVLLCSAAPRVRFLLRTRIMCQARRARARVCGEGIAWVCEVAPLWVAAAVSHFLRE